MQFEEIFFKSEVRNDFKISAMMKRAWAAEMEVLEVIINVCKKNNIKYFADGGTMLGAVRHKGFIPWDDDIDICLLRKDYNRLIEVLKTDLPYGFVLAGMYSDSERLQEAAFAPHARVIADETLWDFNDYMVRFHGFPYQRIGIDIFPIDKICDDAKEDAWQRNTLKHGITILQNWDYMVQNKMLEKELKSFEDETETIFERNDTIKNKMWREIDDITMKYQNEDFEYTADLVFYIDDLKMKFKNQCFDSTVSMKFENMEVDVPIGYDEILRAYYGDYNQFVKISKGHSYPFYKHMQKELLKQIRAVGFRGSVEMFCEEVASGRLRV